MSDIIKELEKSIVDLLSGGEDKKEWIKNVTDEYKKLMLYYKCAMLEIETKFKVLNEAFSIDGEKNPISTIKTRLKSPDSILNKLQKKELSVTPKNIEEKLNDVAGVRVICAFPKDVYDIAEAFLRQDDITLISTKDYIINPKPNGYRSLHMIVEVPIFLAEEKRFMRVEIQFRTIAMDFWASLEHQLRYKKDTEFTKEMADELLACADMSAQLDLKMDKLRQSTNVR